MRKLNNQEKLQEAYRMKKEKDKTKEGKLMEKQQVKVEVTFTEGYEQRFTEALLRQYDNHIKNEMRQEEKNEEEAAVAG